MAITVPVTLAQASWNDYIKILTEGFFWQETKNPSRASIPELNDSIAIRIDHGVRNIIDECSGEPSKFMLD